MDSVKDVPDQVIDITCLVNQEDYQDEFTCIICHNMVFDPQECLECKKWFCKNCIEKWLRSKQIGYRICPHCQVEYKGTKLHPLIVEKILNRVTFQCKECKSESKFSYYDYLNHLKSQCPKYFFKCPNKCAESRIFTKKQLNEHIKKAECPNGFSTCDKCNLEI